MWQTYALLSAFFAALTAIFAKVGVSGVNSNLATAIRTVVILFIAWGIVFATVPLREIREISRHTLLFLVLSGMATGISWLFYFKALQIGEASKVAPLEKISVAFTIILAFVFLGDPLSVKTIIGGVLILGGALVLAL
ncbi:EamA family transporter [Intestinicryptomonas porci]|uniref:EamA family transporter n=1 Tax=Intestinicryptomonas porci TaxID=2926320 RepID=A0ABU4WH29_9BACT|nr:EamA family transporter [Opitutales bacterium CLA-KB-P66]